MTQSMGQYPPANHAKATLAVPFAITAVVVILDQLMKWLVTRSFGPGKYDHRIEVIGRLFALQYVENSGAAFGLLRGQTFVLTLVAIAVIATLLVSYQRARNPSWQLVWGLGL